MKRARSTGSYTANWSSDERMRILIIRPSSMGDVVMASPVLKALKGQTPPPEIHWLIDPALSELLEDNPFVDGLIPWDKRRWNKLFTQFRFVELLREIKKFRCHLKAQAYDLALDLQGLFRSRFLAFISGARERVGFSSREPGAFFMTRLVSKGPDKKLMGSEYLYLMEEMGYEVSDPAPHLFLGKGAEEKANEILKRSGIDGPFFALAPFTTRPQKHWPKESWQKLALVLRDRFGLPSIILGGPGDVAGAQEIIGGEGAVIKNSAGIASIRESAAIISRAEALIGVDTGLTHMGTALKRPTVALFGATCPYLETPLEGTKVLYHKLPCSPCKRRPTCKGDYTCMKKIEVDQVVEALLEIH